MNFDMPVTAQGTQQAAALVNETFGELKKKTYMKLSMSSLLLCERWRPSNDC